MANHTSIFNAYTFLIPSPFSLPVIELRENFRVDVTYLQFSIHLRFLATVDHPSRC